MTVYPSLHVAYESYENLKTPLRLKGCILRTQTARLAKIKIKVFEVSPWLLASVYVALCASLFLEPYSHLDTAF